MNPSRAAVALAGAVATLLLLLGGCRQPPGSVHEVTIKAYRYAFEPDRIVVKQGDQVKVTLAATDVSHGFALDAFGVNQIVQGGQSRVFTFRASRPGRYIFYCSLYCGPEHDRMRGELIVESR